MNKIEQPPEDPMVEDESINKRYEDINKTLDDENDDEDDDENVSNEPIKDKNLKFTIDLHGFTRYSAKICIIRAIKSMNLTDTSYKIVFITGIGNHSTGKTPILNNVLTNVAKTFDYQIDTNKDKTNPGRPYLLKKPTNHQMINNQKKKQRPSTYKKGK